MSKTLDSFVATYSAETPNALAAVDGAVRWGFATLDARVNATALWLLDQGIAPGDRVAVAAAPGLIYYTALMAISRVGGIYVGINPRYTVAEAKHVLTLTDPRLVMLDSRTGADVAAVISEAAGTIPVMPFTAPEDLPDSPRTPVVSKAKDMDVAVIVFTSGSTGQPKGAALHHGGLIAAAQAQSALSDVWPDGTQPRYLSNLPINHVGGIMNLTMASLVAGGALVFQAKFDAGATLDVLADEAITSWLQVPAMFTFCVQHPKFDELSLPHLRTIGIGGGPVSVKTLAALRGLKADIFVEYGQTETMSSLTWSAKTAPDEVLLNTVGRFDPGIEARIANSDGTPVKPGEVGEVQARGNCVLRSYWGNPEATSDVFTDDGWLHTGDLARERTDGRLVLVGRARELIKTGGYNVYPREVEQVLNAHPAIAEVVVFAVPDEVFVERVEAAIELAPGGSAPGQDSLSEKCRETLAGYKIPRAFHVTDGLPRLPNGKIDRTAVRKQFSA